MTSTIRTPGQEDISIDGLVEMDLATLLATGPSGVLWGLDSPQLNANLVALHDGDSIPEHRNDKVDNLIAVLGGSGTVVVDGAEHHVREQTLLLIPRGAVRSIQGGHALRYLSIHVRRAGPSISAFTA